MKNQLAPFIILSVCALALGPLCAGFFGPEWRARWMLALAANQFQDEQFDEAEKTLQSAAQLSTDLTTDPEFWILKLEIDLKKKNGSQDFQPLSKEVQSLIAKSPTANRANLANFVGGLLHQRHQNELAVEILEKFLPPISQRTANENNSIAYFRSKTKKGLEIALREIDAALVADGNMQPEFLDTKAWVLHGLNRNELALTFIQQAIKNEDGAIGKLKGMNEKDRIELQKRLFAAPSTQEASTSTAKNKLEDLTKHLSDYPSKPLEALARRVASLRFHRACILDELGLTEESELDYAWLDGFGFQETDKLN